MTPMLRKLEAKVSQHERASAGGFIVSLVDSQLAYGHRDGYRMALEDLKPVLDAAQDVSIASPYHLQQCLVALRDALAGLEE